MRSMKSRRIHEDRAFNDQLARPAQHERGRRSQGRHDPESGRQEPLDAPPARGAGRGDPLEGRDRERAIDFRGIGPKKTNEHAPRPAGRPMVQQHLETLHGIARPGIVAGDNQVSRRATRRCLEPAARLGRQHVLHALGITGNHTQDLRPTPDHMADRKRRSEKPGCLVNGLAHRVVRGTPADQARHV